MRAKRKGFTLIELIVAMVLAAMLLGALIPLLVTAQKSTYDAQKKTRAAQAGEAIYTYVADQLRSAERVFIGHGTTTPAEPPADQWNQITVGANGCLAINGVTPYPESYQEGAALTLTAQGHDRTALDLTVQLGDLYEKTSAITLQNLIRSGFSQTEGTVGKPLSTADDGDVLTIYYLGGDGTLPTFPTPGDTTPDASHPTPTEDKLTVTVLNKSLRVKQGESATVQAYIHVPAGKTANFAWTSADHDVVTPVVAEAGAPPTSGTLSASGTVTLKIYGAKVTEEGKPITVTLQATLTDTTETKQDTCQVTVYEDNAQPSDEIRLIYRADTNAAGSGDNKNQCELRHIELDAKEYMAGFSLTAFQGAWGSKLYGIWEIIEEMPQGSFSTILNQTSQEKAFLPAGGIPTGTFKIRFTCNGESQDNSTAAKELKGKWTETTITFYNWDEVSANLTWSDKTTSQTAIYVQNAVGLAEAQLTLTPSAGMADYCAKNLPGKMVRLSTGENAPSVWNCGYLSAEQAVVGPVQSGDSYQVDIPLNATGQVLSGAPAFNFWAFLLDGNGKEVIKSNSIKLSLKSTSWDAPEIKLSFDNGSTSSATTYSSGNKLAAKARLTVSVTDKGQADYLKGAEVRLFGENGQDLLEDTPIGLNVLAKVSLGDYVEDSSDRGSLFTFQVIFDLRYLSGNEPENKTYTFTSKISKQPDTVSNPIHLAVTVSTKEGIKLRLGNGDHQGRIVNGEVIYLAKTDSILEITAYENETSTAKQVSGTWKTTGNILTEDHVYWLTWWRNYTNQIRQKDGISEPLNANSANGTMYGAIYTDQQNKGIRTTRVLARQVINHLGWEWNGSYSKVEQWDTTLTFTPDNGSPINVFLKLLDEPEKLTTELHIQDASGTLQKETDVSVGKDAGLQLDTTLNQADYTVEWQMEPGGLFALPGTMAPGQTNAVLKSANVPLAQKTPVTVTAIWRVKGTEDEEFGRDSVVINVEPMEQHFQQYWDGAWQDIQEDTIVRRAGERTRLRVTNENGKSLPGIWNYYDALLKKESDPSDGNVLILYADRATESPVSFTPASSKPLYQTQAVTLKIIDFEIGGSDGVGGAELVLIDTTKEPISILSEDAYPGYTATWYVRRAGETAWRAITNNGDSQKFDEQFQAKPVSSGGMTLQTEFLKKSVSAHYEVYLELVKGTDTKRSQIMTVSQK